MDDHGDLDERGGEDREARELTERQRDVAAAGWCSFLAAAAGAMVLFAFVDPKTLFHVSQPAFHVGRMTGYAIGFFFLWALTGASAALTLYLLRTSHAKPTPRG
jgi:hypothetical protein